MSSEEGTPGAIGAAAPLLGWFGPAMDYIVDATQRSVLFWDVMRQRGNQYREHLAETVPHVLEYEIELVLSGRTLDRPVNYGLVRVVPPAGVVMDAARRPFVVVDPRAGHGPGSAVSRLTARSASPSRLGTLVTSSASFRNPCPARPSKISRAPRQSSSKRSSHCIRMPTASRVSSAIAKPAGRS